MQKFINTDKGFLKKRYLSHLIFKQEGAENSSDMKEPLELDNGTFMCHKCCGVYQCRKTLKRHLREFHQRLKVAKCEQCDYIGASQGALNFHVQSIHLKMFR